MADNQQLDPKDNVPLSSMSRALASRRSHRSLHSQYRSNRSARDVEAPVSQHSDPLGLTPMIKSESEISAIKLEKQSSASGGGNKPPSLNNNKKRSFFFRPEKRVRKFYQDQNEEIRSFLKSVEEHQQDIEDTQTASGLRYQVAVKGSFAANMCLSALQLYAAISSGSLSLITTMVDSCFDPFSGLLLWWAHRTVAKASPAKYPVGRARISTAGNIVFSFVMFTVSVIIIVQALVSFIEGQAAETKAFNLPSVVAVAAAFAVKFGLFLFCWTIKHLFSQVDILWRDHRNDLFVNGFGILTSVGGSKLRWWIDPMGAIILSVLIAGLWLRTAYDEFQLIIGVSAEEDMLRLITYIGKFFSSSFFLPRVLSLEGARPLLLTNFYYVSCRSHDTLAQHQADRHGPGVLLRAAAHRGGGRGDGQDGVRRGGARHGRGPADQTGEAPERGTGLCAHRLRDRTQASRSHSQSSQKESNI